MSEKRVPNFTAKEENILIYIVKKHRDVIENKKTDSNMNNKKIETWKMIEIEFNTESGEVFREASSLKKKYENLKKRTKKRVADDKCFSMGTGGGPPKKVPTLTDMEREIEEILGERAHGHETNFGGDALREETITIIPLTENVDDYGFMENEENPQASASGRDSPCTLKMPISSVLTPVNNKRSRDEYNALCGKVTKWAASKSIVEEEKIKLMRDEHAAKLKIIAEKGAAEIDAIKRQSNAMVKKIEEEMKVNLEGIREQNNLKKEILLIEKRKALEQLKLL